MVEEELPKTLLHKRNQTRKLAGRLRISPLRTLFQLYNQRPVEIWEHIFRKTANSGKNCELCDLWTCSADPHCQSASALRTHSSGHMKVRGVSLRWLSLSDWLSGSLRDPTCKAVLIWPEGGGEAGVGLSETIRVNGLTSPLAEAVRANNQANHKL